MISGRGKCLVPFFLSDLLIHVVLAIFSFLALHQQVVRRSHLVMLVILHKGSRLFKVIACEMVLQHLAEFFDHWDLVFADDDALHVVGLDLLIPFVVP